MRAAVLEHFEQTPHYGDFPEPVAEGAETLVRVTASAIKQLDRSIARGAHYSSPKTLPIIPGTDGAGRLADGSRVYFAAMRRPFGAMAEHAAAAWHVNLPDGVEDAVAAALVNPALAAWLPLSWRAGLAPGETVLVLGATGASGRLAVTAARLLGAGRVIAAGRQQETLNSLGADAIVDLRLEGRALQQAFAEAAGPSGYDVIVDYIWGPPTEALVATLGMHDLAAAEREDDRGIRLVNVGAMAAPNISLPASVLRSSHLKIIGSGTGNYPPIQRLQEFVREILDLAARGELGMEIEAYPLAEVTRAWEAKEQNNRRIVLIP